MARDFFPEWSAQIEKQITGPFVGGSVLSVADLKLFVALGPILKGVIDFVPAETFKGAPKLMALVEAVRATPKVSAWDAAK